MPIQALRSVEDRFDQILRSVSPKRLVREIAMADKGFHFKHFKGYRLDKIGRGRIRKIAQLELFSDPGHELFANLIIVHWNERHARVYQDMVTHVKTINDDVEAIERIEDDKAHDIVDDLLKRHTLEEILLCVRLNGVRFGDSFIEQRLVAATSREEMEAAASADSGADGGEPTPDEAAAVAEPEPVTETETETDASAPTADAPPVGEAPAAGEGG